MPTRPAAQPAVPHRLDMRGTLWGHTLAAAMRPGPQACTQACPTCLNPLHTRLRVVTRLLAQHTTLVPTSQMAAPTREVGPTQVRDTLGPGATREEHPRREASGCLPLHSEGTCGRVKLPTLSEVLCVVVGRAFDLAA